MEWIKIRLKTKPDTIEIVSGLLINTGIQGMVIEDDKEMHEFFKSQKGVWDYIDEDLEKKNREDAFIEFYVSNDINGKETLLNIKNNIELLKTKNNEINFGSLELETENMQDKDWVNDWKKHYKILELGEKIIIKPVWEEYKNINNKIVFEIDPGYAFGTGLHPTTQLTIVNLEKYINNNCKVLDLGTGTGILSIIAMLLGAKEAYAIDIDKDAVKAALKNAQKNNIDLNKYFGFAGDILKDKKIINKINKNKYEVVIANIVTDVILSIKDFVKEVLAEDGIFISSGIICEKKEEVKNEFIKSGFEIIDITEQDEWISIVAKLKR